MVDVKRLFRKVAELSSEQARDYMVEHKEGTYTLLDVRQPSEYETGHLPGARLMPLPTLQNSLGNLDASQPVLVYCRSGRRSMAAAQLLSGSGIDEVYNIKGGIQGWTGRTAVAVYGLDLDRVRGDETPIEVIVLAYGMELALERFYAARSAEADDAEAKRLLEKLSQVETQHQAMLLDLLAQVEPPGRDAAELERDVDADTIEGGLSVKSLAEQGHPDLGAVRGVLELAMAVETQALDLYMRFAHLAEDTRTRKVLLSLSDEEKLHLGWLGDLIDTMS